MALEDIFKNLGKGFATGITKTVDPFGSSISYLDKNFTGVGYSSNRAPDTFHNVVYKKVYDDSKDLKAGKDYLPRGLGALGGLGVGTGIYAWLYLTSGPLFALAAPIVAGTYGLVQTIKKYAKDLSKGEEIKKGNFRKASFKEGFNYGWERWTHLYMDLAHDIEGGLSGRGYNNSKIKSSIKDSSKKARRNIKSVAGSFLGGIVGTVVSVLTLGIFPAYKSVRDTVKNF